jgi:hypothetical protein
MLRLTEITAATLSPAQAADLVRVLDLQAEWQNLKDDGRDHSTARLQGLQRTFEAFRLGLAAYADRYGADRVPEAMPTSPERLRDWCRVVGAVVRRGNPTGETGSRVHMATQAYRLADGVAGRLNRERVVRASDTSADVLGVLATVGDWCDGLVGMPSSVGAEQPPSWETPAAAEHAL